jgi:hypothetical protein
LNVAANMSKVFWGSAGKFAVQRKPVRDLFGVTDTSGMSRLESKGDSNTEQSASDSASVLSQAE